MKDKIKEISDLFKRARKDEHIKGVDSLFDCEMIPVVKMLPPKSYISEWRYGMGEIRYEYYIHSNSFANKLKKVLNKGINGYPFYKLTNIYSKKDLKEILNKKNDI